MAKNQRDPAKEAYWRRTLQRQGVSGLSVRAFCRQEQQEQLSEPSFHSWRRTIRRRDGGPADAAFVPAVVMAASRSEASIAIELAGGGVLRFSGPLATEQLADLIVALRSRVER